MQRTHALLIGAAAVCVALTALAMPTPADARRLRLPIAALRVVASPLYIITSRIRSVARRGRAAALAPAAAPAVATAMPAIGRGAGIYWTYTFNDLMDDVLQPPDGKRYIRMTDVCAPQAARAESIASAKREADAEIDAVAQMLQPTEAQRGVLDEFHTAWTRALDDLAASCPADAAAMPAQRLATAADYLSALWRAAIHVHTPLERFYASLTDEQKARLNGNAGAVSSRDRPAKANASPSQLVCAESARVVPAWPAGRLEQQIGANPEQRANLAALRMTSSKMAEFVAASCPREPPPTPLARLSAEENQLMTMIFAVQAINEPLARFYDSLSDGQKSRFQASLQ